MVRLFFIILFLCAMSTAQAENLGVWGTVYPIAEQDITQFIHQRLKTMMSGGEYAKFQQQWIHNVQTHTERPVPVQGLTTTDHPKTFYYDPTWVLTHAIKDATGTVLFPAGTRINPLEKIKLHKVLFFLNADDKRQVKWALKQVKHYDFVKYILIQGAIKAAGEGLDSRVYFDQEGRLSHQLGIQHVPCIVFQQGNRLVIKEYALPGNEEGRV